MRGNGGFRQRQRCVGSCHSTFSGRARSFRFRSLGPSPLPGAMYCGPQVIAPLHVESEVRPVAEDTRQGEGGRRRHVPAVVAQLVDRLALHAIASASAAWVRPKRDIKHPCRTLPLTFVWTSRRPKRSREALFTDLSLDLPYDCGISKLVEQRCKDARNCKVRELSVATIHTGNHVSFSFNHLKARTD